MTDISAVQQPISRLLLDMDGTVYVGGVVIDGVADAIARWEAAGNDVLFITNNTSRTLEQHAAKLQRMGLPATVNNVLSPVEPTARSLRESGETTAYLVATEAVTAEFETHGISHSDTDPDVVVITYDIELTYSKLAAASAFINRGIPYIATHLDFFCPTENGPVPDIGSFTTMLESVTGVSPREVFGKPSDSLVEIIRTRYPSNSLLVGDRLHTDILTGINANVPTCLVLSGETTLDMLAASPHQPTIVAENLPALIDALVNAESGNARSQ